ncbi:hypothetical protein HPB52_009754 [Rhipicephalus sanguineus]|uniref:Ionotropic glutamate receptor C-terminal domain-containing protein n=1 Tax=Rhipicephalus sanguineus TaxID=34632 RepID=A0A9D4PNF9_RHISA|nr:hypothetical protein HPB52_009754 [Rhipicephalus sanguineus]
MHFAHPRFLLNGLFRPFFLVGFLFWREFPWLARLFSRALRFDPHPFPPSALLLLPRHLPAPSLLDMVATALGLEYEIRASADGSDYGTLSAREGRWSGLVREVFEREADLAIGDITITRERLEYVDFTTPFLQNDLGVLYRNVDRDFHDRLAFLRPWTGELWLCTATAALASSLALAFASRLSAAEALATRIMAVVWWLFALVLITSYTASLASQIIAQHLQAPLIQSIGDLSKQSKINYGCVTKSVTRGLLKVREEGFAVLMDSQTIEYLVAHDCSLVQLPGRLETGGFGFAMPQELVFGAVWSGIIAVAITMQAFISLLQENGTLRALRQRWWSSMHDVDPGADRRCNPTVDGSSSAAGTASGSGSGSKDTMGIRGLLLVLGIGCLVSLLVVVAECLWRFRCSSKRRNQGPRWRKKRRSIPPSLSLQESNLIILDPPKEFQDDHESCPMTSYKCETLT